MHYRVLRQPLPAESLSGPARRFALFKVLRLMAEFTRASLILWLRFPRLQRDARLREIQHWAKKVLLILEVKVQCEGALPPPGAALVVANHISWLDVLVMQSLTPGVFVAKAEVRQWPLIGAMAHVCATIFVDRSSPRSARTMLDGTLQAFEQGYSVVAFPEGTSSDGSDLAAFHANIFECAIRAQTQVQPVTLGYLDAQTGSPSEAAMFTGDMTLVSSLRKVLTSAPIKAQVHIGECIASRGHTRRSLAKQAQQSIRGQLARQRQGLV